MSKEVHGYGPSNAKIMLVGEAPGSEEVYEGRPFIGSSGKVLDSMLADAGLNRDLIYTTNVCRVQPYKNAISTFFAKKSDAKKAGLKEIDGKFPLSPILEGIMKLQEEVHVVNPEIVIAAGNTALWALTGLTGTGGKTNDPSPTGITSWRGSQLVTKPMYGRRKVLPIIHPAGISRNWEQRWHTLIDLQRSKLDSGRSTWTTPNYRFIVRPSFNDACTVLGDLEQRAIKSSTPIFLALDVETRLGFITCVGIAWSATDAICIPVVHIERSQGYFSIPEEAEILYRIHQLVKHPNIRVIGQNWNYDRQYFAKNYGIDIPPTWDTLIRQHVLLPGTPKSLDFLSSIYCSYHVYWKDESTDWDPTLGEEQHWIYNCKDCVVTWEVGHKQEVQLEKSQRKAQEAIIMSKAKPTFFMELRGINTNHQELARQRELCQTYLAELADWLDFVIPQTTFSRAAIPPGPYDSSWWQTHQHPIARKKRGAFWFDSTDQQKRIFYEILQLPVKFKMDKIRGRVPSMDETALEDLKQDEPALAPIFEALIQYRSFKTLMLNFLGAKRDWDKRNRTSLNIAGPETFRDSSSQDAFGFGSNIQNITKGDK